MKSCCIIFVFLSCIFTLSAQTVPDSLINNVLNSASQGDVSSLKRDLGKYGAKLPSPVRLFASVSLARADRNYSELIVSVDSLLDDYAFCITPKNRLALTGYKAEALMKQKMMKEAQKYLEASLRYFKEHDYKRTAVKPLKNLYALVNYFLETKSGKLEALLYANQFFKLQKAMQVDGNSADLSPLLRDKIKMALATAFNRPDEILDYGNKLLFEYADSVRKQDKAGYMRSMARVYVTRGDWKGLKCFLSKIASEHADYPLFPFSLYERMADEFGRYPKTSMELPKNISFPSMPLSVDWPLLTEGVINQKEKIHLQLVSGQEQSLITMKQAERAGAVILKDTINLVTMGGRMTVCPVWLRTLQVGDVTFRNLVVYAVQNKLRSDSVYACALGCRELMRLKRIHLYPEKIVVDKNSWRKETSAPNLCMSPNASLLLSAEHDDKQCLFSLDMGSPSNLLSLSAFSGSQEPDSSDFSIRVDRQIADLSNLSFIKGRIPGFSGILGVPFLRLFKEARLDFQNMRFSAKKPKEYRPLYLSDYTFSDSPFKIERNACSLLAGCEQPFLKNYIRLWIARGKNQTKRILALSKEIDSPAFQKKAPEAWIQMKMMQANALMEEGRYAAAAKERKRLLSSVLLSAHAAASVSQDLILAERLAEAAVPPASFEMNSDSVSLLLDDKNNCLKGLAGKKSVYARFSVSRPYAEVPVNLAKKCGARVVATFGDSSWGYIPELSFGENCVIKNALCKITSVKKDYVTLGFYALQLLSGMNFQKHKVVLYKIFPSSAEKTFPVRFENFLYVQAASKDGYCVLRMTEHGPNAFTNRRVLPVYLGAFQLPAGDFVPGGLDRSGVNADGVLSLDYLIKKKKRVFFNFRNMTLSF